MAATAIPLNGSSLVIQISDDDGTTWDVIGFPTSATLTTGLETRDITNKLSCGWSTKGEGMRTWSVSGDGLVTFAVVAGEVDLITLFAHYNERTQAMVRVTTWDCAGSAEIVGDPAYTGSAYLTSYELTGGLEDNATYSFTFDGSGPLVETVNA